MTKTLMRGMSGPEVAAWQRFLLRERFLTGSPDGEFGPATETATRKFQASRGLRADGVVGPRTAAEMHRSTVLTPLTGNAERARIFGAIEFRRDPKPGNPECIRITNDFAKRNLVTVEIPQLARIARPVKQIRVTFHRLAAARLRALWERWEQDGLLSLVQTWDGAFNPRLVRGSRSVLSNHAFGTAFDINAATNPMGRRPPLVGEPGSVRRLVASAQALGFYWGGHFSRPDGMHFEFVRP